MTEHPQGYCHHLAHAYLDDAQVTPAAVRGVGVTLTWYVPMPCGDEAYHAQLPTLPDARDVLVSVGRALTWPNS